MKSAAARALASVVGSALPATVRRPLAAVAVAGLLTAAVSPGAVLGQVAWDAPRMIGPETPGGVGAYWMRAGALSGDGDAAIVTLTFPGTGQAVTLRGGVGNGAGEEPAGFGGVDVRAPLARHSADQPLDLEWHAGLGVGVGLYQLASLPMGISAGRSWSSGSVWFAPYVSVGATLEYRRGEEAPAEEFGVDPTAGVGVDLAFDPERRFVIRAATSLGDRQAISVGLLISGGS